MPERLLSELRHLARTLGGGLNWFAERMEDLQLQQHGQPAKVAVPGTMVESLPPATSLTASVVDALLKAANALHWSQSYTARDGFSDGYLNNYGFVNVISPVGHFVSDKMRVSLGYWGKGLHYPEHAHAPEEWYVMLAGGCHLTSEGVGARPVMAGEIAHHKPWQRHSLNMRDTPLLAAAFWRGEGLMDTSKIYETP